MIAGVSRSLWTSWFLIQSLISICSSSSCVISWLFITSPGNASRDSFLDKQEKVQNPVSEMKFSGLWRYHRVFGFDQTHKSSDNKKQQSTRLNFNCMFLFNIFKCSTLLRGTTLSSENIGSWSWKFQMLPSHAWRWVSLTRKKRLPRQTMLAETFSRKWAKDWKKGFKRMGGIWKESTHSRLFLFGWTRGLNAV